jgi:heptosyltransferase I
LNSRCLTGAERRLLLVLPKGIGDVVYGLALVEAIKSAHPEIEITWVVGAAAAPLLAGHAAIRRVLVYDNTWSAFWHLRRQLRGERFDVVLNLGKYLHSLPPALAARAERTICLDRDYARDHLQWFHRERVAVPDGAHVMDVFSAAGRYLGLQPGPPAWHLGLTPEEVEQQADYFAACAARPRVALVPCAGRAEKDWDADRFGELARRLHARCDAAVVVVGGPTPAEARAASRIVARAPDTRVALGNDLRRVIWVLAACDLAVAPDTGPLHIARALGIPLVGLYGHTDPVRYGPYPPYTGTLIDRYHFDGPGVPSVWQGSGGRAGRMERIEVDEVEVACLQALSLHRSLGDRRRGDSRA